MSDILQIGCAGLRGSYLPLFMQVVGFFGYNSIAVLVGCALLVWGYLKKEPALRRHGWVVLISLACMGTIVLLLKHTVHLPRPSISSRLSFPSGDTGTAFVLAAALAGLAPAWSPLFYLLAALTGISRLYLRLHFVADVVAGAAIGASTAWLVAAKLGIKSNPCRRRRAIYAGLLLVLAAAAPVLAFFYALERQISAHRIAYGREPIPQRSGITVFHQQKAPIVTGSVSPALPAPSAHNLVFVATVFKEGSHQLFFDAGADTREFVCRWTETRINGAAARRVYFEHGWHRYKIPVPQDTFRPGANRVDFNLPIMPPSWLGTDPGTISSNWTSLEITHVHLARPPDTQR